jgi:predicted alpha/beta-fold hydrolase
MFYTQGFDSVAWDHDVMHGCLCDSTWAVGYGQGETQLAEYFGADCSLSECSAVSVVVCLPWLFVLVLCCCVPHTG